MYSALPLFSDAVQESPAMAAPVAAKDMRSLSDPALIASLFGVSEQDARLMMSSAGSLREALRRMPAGQAFTELCRRYLTEEVHKGDAISDPDTVRQFLTAQLRDKPAECFCVLFLDNRHRIIAFKELFHGTINSASVHPREVVRAALEHNAAAVILAHNHPSGNPEPSRADERITQRLCDALNLIEVRVLDHFVVGDQIVSFTERGLL